MQSLFYDLTIIPPNNASQNSKLSFDLLFKFLFFFIIAEAKLLVLFLEHQQIHYDLRLKMKT